MVDVLESVESLETGGISVFPNPAQTLVTIELKTPETFSLLLFDVKGKVVLEQTLSSKNNVLTLSELAAGNYIIQLQQAATGKVFSGKLMKK
jgi:hypothetical protein